MDLLRVVARSKDPAFAVDSRGRVIIWNQAAEALLGIPADQVLGEPCYGILCDLATDRPICHSDCALRSGNREPISQVEMTIPNAEGGLERITMCALSLPETESTPETMLHFFRVLPSAEAGATGTNGARTRPALTSREREVLTLLAEGHHTKEVSRRLFISVATVRNHIQNILRKLDAHTRMEAIARARRFSLI